MDYCQPPSTTHRVGHFKISIASGCSSIQCQEVLLILPHLAKAEKVNISVSDYVIYERSITVKGVGIW